jgi:hypothetical protein
MNSFIDYIITTISKFNMNNSFMITNECRRKIYTFELIPDEIYENLLRIKGVYYSLIVVAHTSTTNMKRIFPLLKNMTSYQREYVSLHTSGNGYWKLYDWFLDHYSSIILNKNVVSNAAKRGNMSFLMKPFVEKYILSSDNNMVNVVRSAILSKNFHVMRYYVHKRCYRKRKNNKFYLAYKTSNNIMFHKFIDVLAQVDDINQYNWMKKSLGCVGMDGIFGRTVDICDDMTKIIRNRGYNIMKELYTEHYGYLEDSGWNCADEFMNAAILSNDLRIFLFLLKEELTVSCENLLLIVRYDQINMLKILHENREHTLNHNVINDIYLTCLIYGSYDIFIYLTDTYTIPIDLLSHYDEHPDRDEYPDKDEYFETQGTVKIMQVLLIQGYIPSKRLYKEIFKREIIDLLCIIDNGPYKNYVCSIISSGKIHSKISIEFIEWLFNTFDNHIDINQLNIVMIMKDEINVVKWLFTEKNVTVDSDLLIKCIKSDQYKPFMRVKMIEFLHIHGNLSVECWETILEYREYISVKAFKFIEIYMQSYITD